MTNYASVECQQFCDVITGPVHDVREAETNDEVETVVMVRHSGEYVVQTSAPLHDLGETDGHNNNEHYLKAVQSCAGAVACSGRFRTKYECGAMVGDHPLRDYRTQQ